MDAVLKVVVTGPVTSFRYPHFVMQTQPTFELPPPATIYGHICSAVGELVDPGELAFGYHFTFDAIFDDLEYIRIWEGSRRTGFFKVNPFTRQLIFNPQLTLYLYADDLEAMRRAFYNPRYAVVLGRSQDLMAYQHIEIVELVRSDRAYYEHTLLPFEWAGHVQQGYTITMPRYIDPRRQVTSSKYLALHDRVVYPREGHPTFAQEPTQHWVDPSAPTYRTDIMRGVYLHTFVDA